MDARIPIAVILAAALIAGPVSGAGKDKDLRSLLITVLQTDDAELSRGLLANTSAAGANGPGYHMTTRTYGTATVRQPSGFQQVRVIEGQRALYSIRYSSPEVRLLWVEDTSRGVQPNVGLVNRDIESGFYVQAELHGNKVLLQLDRYNGQAQPDYAGRGLFQDIRTTLEGPLGDWLDAGGSLVLEENNPDNHSYSLPRRNREYTRLLIKVELVPG